MVQDSFNLPPGASGLSARLQGTWVTWAGALLWLICKDKTQQPYPLQLLRCMPRLIVLLHRSLAGSMLDSLKGLDKIPAIPD